MQKVEDRLGEIVKVLGMGHRPRTNASVHDNIKWLLEIQGPVLESECTVQQVPYRRLPHTLFPPAYLAHGLLACSFCSLHALPCLALAQALKTVATRVKNVADRVTESPVKTTSEVLAEICGCIREGKAAAKSSVSSIAPAPSSIAVKAVGKAKASDMRVVEMEEEGTLPPEA